VRFYLGRVRLIIASYYYSKTIYDSLESHCVYIGASFYSFDPDINATIPNNSVILTDNFGQIQNLQCISGSRTPDAGRWIAPNGQDITYSNGDPFEIIIGGANDPGYLEIRLDAGRSLRFTDQGIYPPPSIQPHLLSQHQQDCVPRE